jgi:hypothetical protein
MTQPHTPKFPNLDVFDDMSAMLDAANGACGVLAETIGSSEGVGTDFVKAAYAIGYLIEAVRDKLSPVHTQFLHYRNGRA